MAFSRGPKIVTDGLVLCLDTGNVKSFRGEPTVNKINLDFNTNFDLLSDGDTAGFTNQLGSGNYLGVSSFIGYSSLKSLKINRGTGGTGRVYRTFSVALGEYSTVSAWVYSNVAGPYLTLEYFGGDYSWSVPHTRNTHTGNGWELLWVKTTGTATSSTTCYYFLWPGVENFDTYWDNIQAENKAYQTPYVNGTRGTTVATGGGLKDLSGLGNNGEVLNGLTYNSSYNGVLSFDGANDYVNLTNVLDVSLGNYTVSFYTKINSSSTAFTTLFSKKGIAAANAGYATYYNGSIKKLMWSNGDGTTAQEYYTNNTIPLDVWINVVCVRDVSSATKGYFYINGVLYPISTNPTGLNVTNSYDFTIGKNSNGSLYFDGMLSDLKMYSRALTVDEITQNYNATKQRFNL